MTKTAAIILTAGVIAAASIWAVVEVKYRNSATTDRSHILVTINPEARVTAEMISAPPPSDRCGDPVSLNLTIRNEATATALLIAELPIATAGVAIDRDPTPLTGRPTERRALRLTRQGTGSRDITLSFSLNDGTYDPEGKARVHMLLRCKGNW